MNKIIAATPKGFRDFLPQEALKRKFVLDKITAVFQKFGFDPLETPTLEYAQTLKGKYGEDEKLIYEFTTRGGDEVALRYDQTVPLARVIAQYPQLPKPFKRYQTQSAFRGENPQKGRYREFLQCDADIIGVSTPLADAEMLSLAAEIYQTLGVEIIIKINDRLSFEDIDNKYLSAIDKLNKIGQQGVLNELTEKGLNELEAQQLLKKILGLKPSENLSEIRKIYQQMGYDDNSLVFDPTLVRGLDYYTGLIFEVVLKSDPNSSSLLGGGRWDKMIGKFTGQHQSAVGFAIGFDRTLEAMDNQGLIPNLSSVTQVLVTIFSDDLLSESIRVCSKLRGSQINCEVWLDTSSKLDKQLKYADVKGVRFAAIIGPDEAKEDKVTLKDLKSGSQESLSVEQVITEVKDAPGQP